MRLNRALALGASLLVLFGACTTGGGSTQSPAGSTAPSTAPSAAPATPSAPPPAIRIGSDGFYESKLMGEIYAQVLEANGYTVERNLGLGPRKVSAPALESGQIDLKPEYIGKGSGYYDKTKPTGDPAGNAAELATILATKGTRARLHARPGHQRVRRPQGHRRPVRPQDDERSHRRRGQADLGPSSGVCHQPLCVGALKDAYGIDIAAQKVKAPRPATRPSPRPSPTSRRRG